MEIVYMIDDTNKMVCPYCKELFKRGDACIVCPDCKTVHHEKCWTENGGCANLYCKDQKENATGQKAFNSNPNSDDENIQANIDFAVQDIKRRRKKKFLLLGVISSILIIAVIFSSVLIYNSLKKDCDYYLSMGDYSNAYYLAKTEEKKKEVVLENTIAVCSSLVVETMKNPESFYLRDGWYAGGKVALLKSSGTNSFGGVITNYILFTYSNGCWKIYDSYSDFDEETASYYDDLGERLEKAFHNIGLAVIKDIITPQNKMDSKGVDRINSLFTNKELSNVKLSIEAMPS